MGRDVERVLHQMTSLHQDLKNQPPMWNQLLAQSCLLGLQDMIRNEPLPIVHSFNLMSEKGGVGESWLDIGFRGQQLVESSEQLLFLLYLILYVPHILSHPIFKESSEETKKEERRRKSKRKRVSSCASTCFSSHFTFPSQLTTKWLLRCKNDL